jgi:hypothetical protein
MKKNITAFLFFINFITFSQKYNIVEFSTETEINNFKSKFSEINLIPTYKIDDKKFDELKNDAIKVTGNDENILKLKKNYYISINDSTVINYLKNNKIKFFKTHDVPIPPPSDIPPATPSFVIQQSYLGANPGLNVEAVWQLGHSGQNCKIHLIEYGFNKSHEEFNNTNCNIATDMTVNSSATTDYTEHGTATMGVLYGHNGNYGVTGISYGVQQVILYPEWQESGYDRVNAITKALNNSSIGDIIVFEMQTFGYGSTATEPKFVPAEYEVSVWNLTKALTDSGRIVVAAAGNGSEDLDHSNYSNYLNLGDSGSIIVGGGTPDLNHEISTYISTYGSRVDVQGWHTNVRSTGALPGFLITLIGNDFNQSYMNFSGTSSATAQVGGVATLLQSFHKSLNNNWLTSQQLRTILKNTGIPQGGDLTKNIGPLPNTLTALNYIQQNLNSKSFLKNDFMIYPNPTKNKFNILRENSNPFQLKIFDITGKLIFSKSIINNSSYENEIDISDLSLGIYLMKIEFDNQIITKKIIKE